MIKDEILEAVLRKILRKSLFLEVEITSYFSKIKWRLEKQGRNIANILCILNFSNMSFI